MPALKRVIAAIILTCLALPIDAAEFGELPASMPGEDRSPTASREMNDRQNVWKQIAGFENQRRGDALVLKDFMPIRLQDGSYVVHGLGLRAKEAVINVGRQQQTMLQILDVQEFGPVWNKFGSNGFKIGGYIGGSMSNLEQSIRTTLGGRPNRLQNGYSIPTTRAQPFEEANGNRDFQLTRSSLSFRPGISHRGRWIVAEADAASEDPEAVVADAVDSFRERLQAGACAITVKEVYEAELRIEDLNKAAGREGLPFRLRIEWETACTIEREGSVPEEAIMRLAMLRHGMCDDVTNGMSDELQAAAAALTVQIPPSRYLNFARIGMFDILNPDRVGLSKAEGAERKDCILQYLEDSMFAR